jgi:hypothetical protein
LCAQPFGGGDAVFALEVERAELAAGAERAAGALDDRLQAVPGERVAEELREQALAPVRRADQHHRRGRRAGRGVPVGEQRDAVGHRHRQVAGDDRFRALGRGQREHLVDKSVQHACPPSEVESSLPDRRYRLLSAPAAR